MTDLTDYGKVWQSLAWSSKVWNGLARLSNAGLAESGNVRRSLYSQLVCYAIFKTLALAAIFCVESSSSTHI